MSKKHFESVAKAIRELYIALDIRETPHQSVEDNMITTAKLFGIRYTAEALADGFADANPRFDRIRFLAACGFTSEDQAI